MQGVHLSGSWQANQDIWMMCYFCQDCQDIWAINGPKIPKSGYFAFLLSKCQDDVRIFQKFQSTLPVLFHFDTLSSSWNLNWKVHLRSNTGIWVMQISKFSPTMVVHEGWWSGDLIWVNYSGLPLWLESLERLEIHIVLRDFSDVAGFWYIFYPHNPDFFSIWRRFKVQFYSFENLTFQNFLRPWWRTKIIFWPYLRNFPAVSRMF